MKKAVVDASVVLKWYLLDEVLGDRSLALLESYSSRRLELAAPSLLTYELINGLVIAGRRSRLEPEAVQGAFSGFEALGITLVDSSRFSARLPHFCQVFPLSAYDASYAAVAELENAPLVTADQRLYQALKTVKGLALWLGDWKGP